MQIDNQLLSEFSCWFDSDLIDIDNPEKMLEDARMIGVDISKRDSASRILKELDFMLFDWKPNYALVFVKASNVDWNMNSRTKSILSTILTEIRDTIAHELLDRNTSESSL